MHAAVVYIESLSFDSSIEEKIKHNFLNKHNLSRKRMHTEDKCTALNWTEPIWTELNWTELNGAELSWIELGWTELNWFEMNRTELMKFALNWIKQNCTELNWTELNWLELEWTKPTKLEWTDMSKPNWPELKWTELNRIYTCGWPASNSKNASHSSRLPGISATAARNVVLAEPGSPATRCWNLASCIYRYGLGVVVAVGNDVRPVRVARPPQKNKTVQSE